MLFPMPHVLHFDELPSEITRHHSRWKKGRFRPSRRAKDAASNEISFSYISQFCQRYPNKTYHLSQPYRRVRERCLAVHTSSARGRLQHDKTDHSLYSWWRLGRWRCQNTYLRSVVQKTVQKLDCYILSVNYRMAPEHPYPVPLEDCYSVLSWLGNMKLSQDFVPEVVDRQRVILMGDSAGGNLAAATAMLWRDRGLAGITVVHQVLLYPCFCTRPLTESRTNAALGNKAMLLKPWMMDFYERMYTPDGKTVEDMSNDPYVNCTSANDVTMLPPITGLVGGADILRDEGVAYFVKVAREGNGVDVEWRQWDYAIHGFCVFPGKDADNALAYIIERLHPYMDPVSNV